MGRYLSPGQASINFLKCDRTRQGVADFEPSRFEAEFGRHFAVFHAGSDFPALKRRLAEHGATVIDPIRPTPFQRFFFRDPNGYVFEVIDRDGYDPEGSERRA